MQDLIEGGFGILGILGTLIVLLITILWIATPFLIMGVSIRLDKILKALNEIRDNRSNMNED